MMHKNSKTHKTHHVISIT